MNWDSLVVSNRQVRFDSERLGDSPWARSQFGWLKKLANIPRGQAAVKIVEKMLVKRGYKVTTGRLAQSFNVNHRVVKLKLSMAWSGSRVLKFQQIEDDSYTHLATLGLEVRDAWFWLCPKSVAWRNAAGQHRTDRSRWIQLRTDQLPRWLEPYGGHISGAEAICLQRLGSP
jgi:hypothetical protein